MFVSEFDYDLPPELIAQQPLAERDASRMMVLYRQTGEIIHSHFRELPNFLSPGDIVVFNDSKVIPARVWGKCQDREVDFLFIRQIAPRKWAVLCRPARKVIPGAKIIFPLGMEATVAEKGPEGQRILEFPTNRLLSWLYKVGYPPLPPYIKRQKANEALRKIDLTRYQTIFARKEGSIAAPTAGLHFTPRILKKLKEKGITTTRVTLHVGLATFQPVRVERVEDHQMLEEWYEISPRTASLINEGKKEGRAIVAVGTTVVRTLESAAEFQEGKVLLRPGRRITNLFIYPGYQFKIVDRLLTNFHLPRSTLLMLVAAFAGKEFILKAYQEAVNQKYRFFSYGDCMLIL
ncbi:MAG: tRNA preQ1(34) S-adenosylmethionine ribosyltransferase-isomerase QueA [Candidatus Aminicenantes bacterium]|nr:tRNA preQ1(34) S-adenosylmethionine ribosyltransferase-isomerase QueA [Candidatus Aminicenantes bacterium]